MEFHSFDRVPELVNDSNSIPILDLESINYSELKSMLSEVEMSATAADIDFDQNSPLGQDLINMALGQYVKTSKPDDPSVKPKPTKRTKRKRSRGEKRKTNSSKHGKVIAATTTSKTCADYLSSRRHVQEKSYINLQVHVQETLSTVQPDEGWPARHETRLQLTKLLSLLS